MDELREAANEYLEKRMMDPPSIVDKDAEGREREAEEMVWEIERRTNLDHSTQTRKSANVHFQRQPFQSSMTADRSTAVTPQVDD